MFKSIKKKRPIRKASSSESEEEEVNQEALEETIELQKLRKELMESMPQLWLVVKKLPKLTN